MLFFILINNQQEHVSKSVCQISNKKCGCTRKKRINNNTGVLKILHFFFDIIHIDIYITNLLQ